MAKQKPKVVDPLWNQQLFNKVATHLFKQGKPAKNEKGLCCYKTKSGLRCAIGCLIPPRLFIEEMNNSGYIFDLLDNYPTIFHPWHKKTELLLALQDIHDTATSWKSTDVMPNLNV